MELNTINIGGMSVIVLDVLLRSNIPNLYHIILSARCNTGAIRVESNRVDTGIGIMKLVYFLP